jgi:hypothetical protein
MARRAVVACSDQANTSSPRLAVLVGQTTESCNVGLFHVRGVALGRGAAWAAVGASAAAAAPVPRRVLRTGARMAGAVVRVSALLHDRLTDLRIGHAGAVARMSGQREKREDEEQS